VRHGRFKVKVRIAALAAAYYELSDFRGAENR